MPVLTMSGLTSKRSVAGRLALVLLSSAVCAAGQIPKPKIPRPDEAPGHLVSVPSPRSTPAVTRFRGRWLDYEVVDGWAVHDGDIILGTAREAAAASPGSGAGKPTSAPWLVRRDVSAVEDSDFLWPEGIVPYVIDENVESELQELEWAIDLWNSNTVITLVPRTTEADFVRFSAETPGCAAHLGRIGGQQTTWIGNCGDYGIAHEIGHVVGLYHPHERVDRDEFIMFGPGETMGDAKEPATGPYDYRSNMHWPYRYFETIPPGMPYGSFLSPGDIDGVARLYGKRPEGWTISTNPAGLEVIVDGQRVRAPATFDWEPGSTHVLEAPLQQGAVNGVHYLFGRWTDGASRKHSVTADAGNTWYQASFVQRNRSQVRIHPSREAGQIRIRPEAADGYHAPFQQLELTASPSPDTAYRFLGWRVDSFATPDWATSSARIEADVLDLVGLTAEFSENPFFRIDSNVPLLALWVDDGVSEAMPVAFKRTPAAFDVRVSPRLKVFAAETMEDPVRPGTRVRFRNWSDGGQTVNENGWHVREIEVPPQGGELSLQYAEEHLLTARAKYGGDAYGRILVSPPSADGYYEPGTTVELTAKSPGFFVRWTGDASGTGSRVSITMDRPRSVRAVFSAKPWAPDAEPPPEPSVYPRALTFVTHEGFGDAAQVIRLTSHAPEQLPFRVDANQDWLRVEPRQGMLAAGGTSEITVTASIAGLPPGVHAAEITAAIRGRQDGEHQSRDLRVQVHHVKLGTQPQRVELAEGAELVLRRHWDGVWRLGEEIVKSGYRHVHAGDAYVFELVGGRWKAKPPRHYRIRSVAGSTEVADGIPAVNASLYEPDGVAVDALGNVFVTERGNDRVRKIDPAGVISTLAGTGDWGYGGDGGPASEAQLLDPAGVAVDGAGNVYVSDRGNRRVRKIDVSGIISTLAGTGEAGIRGDGGRAGWARFLDPVGVAADVAGNVYVVDQEGNRVRKIDTSGIISTLAGTGEAGSGGDGGPASSAQLFHPAGVAADTSGNVYIADTGNRRVRRIDRAGMISTFAGTGDPGHGGDGGPATDAAIAYPVGVATDAAGNVYVAGPESMGVRRIDASGIITTLAGGEAGCHSGDGDPATGAAIANPIGVAADAAGNLYAIERSGQRICKVDTDGTVTAVAGTGAWRDARDGGSVLAAQFHFRFPQGAALDRSGNLLFLDGHRVWKLDAAGTVAAIAGTGSRGYSGDGGPATAAALANPSGVALDAAGNLYIADTQNHRVRKVDTLGIISTIAGTGSWDHSGDGGPATAAALAAPSDVTLDTAGNLYVADLGNDRIRKIDPLGIISTVAGSGSWDHSGDGGPATAAALVSPSSVALDAAGNLYVGEGWEGRIRKIDVFGTITTLASIQGSIDALAVDLSGSIYAGSGYRIFKIYAEDGGVSVLAGTGEPGFGGDGGPARAARLSVSGLAVDRFGTVWFTDGHSRRVRALE